jgi:hypothetical protein
MMKYGAFAFFFFARMLGTWMEFPMSNPLPSL